MTAQRPDAMTVVARFTARHDAEIARSYLADHDIDAFILADNVHVPLQFTDGVRLVVMQGEAEEAYQRLEEADSIPDALAERADWEEDSFNGESEDVDPKLARKAARRQEVAVATTAGALVVAVLFFIPWRVESTGDLVWSPLYRRPFSHTSPFEALRDAQVYYESVQVAFDIFVLQVLSIAAIGWITSVLVGTVWSRPREEV